MRPGAPCAAAGGAPCPGSITAFWTRPLSDQRPPGPGTSGSLPNSSSRHARRTETASAPSMPCEEGAGSARRWRGGNTRSATRRRGGRGARAVEGGSARRGAAQGWASASSPARNPKVVSLAPALQLYGRFPGARHFCAARSLS